MVRLLVGHVSSHVVNDTHSFLGLGIGGFGVIVGFSVVINVFF